MSEPLEHGSKTAIEEATEHQPVRMPYPCRRIAKVAKTTLVSALIILTVLGSVDTVLPGIIQALAASALPETVGQNTRCMPTPPNATATTSYDALRCSSLTSQTPQIVGADEVPNLSLPKTVISSINTLIGAGGVVQTSPDNLTIYNLGLAVRLLANPFPHDVLLGPGHRALNSSSSWNVEVSISKLWVRLVPVSSRFTILGTNSSGTFVVRTTSVATGVYSGTLVVVYHARPDGSLKWSVGFTPASSGDYAFVYDWLNTTRASLPVGEDRSFRSRIGSANYTFSWSDVPRSLNATSTASSTEFSLQIDMGTVQANSTFQIDPQLVSSSISSNPTGFTFQRKIFYDANSGYYFAFYYDGYLVGYSSSHDGLGWSARQQMAPNWPGYNNDPASLPYIYNSGGTVWAVSGEETVACTGCANTVHAYVASGNVSTSSIIWQPTQKIISFKSLSDPSLFRPTFGFRYVSVALDAGSRLAFSYNFYASDQTGGLCYQGAPKESVLGVIYNNQNFLASCNSNDQNQERSVIVPAPGGLRLVYQDHAGSSAQLLSRVFYGGPGGSLAASSVADTYTSSSQGQQGNHGTETVLDLSHAYGAFTENTYIRFNNPVLPAGGQFASATLTYNWQGYGTASAALLIYSLDSSWTETGLNYTYHPLWTTPSTGIGNIVGNSCGGRCTSWAPKTVDVSPVIGGMYIANFPNNGMVLTISDPANDCSSCSWTDITLESRESGFPPLLTVYYNCCMGNVETLDGNVADGDSFSATADAQLGTHTLYREAADGTVTYAYHAAMSSSWTFSANIFSGPASYPTITCDYSTGDVFAMGVEGSSGSVIAMRRKSMAGLWADNTAVFPVTGRAGVKELGSNAASASEAGSSSILLFWTEGTISPYSATFARVPVQTVWSPYSAPGDPWDKNGLAPYGQYFSNLGESVSPSTGMLTVRQTDLSVPGRGLDLAITRVYTEPFSFHNGSPYNYETYPWAPMGNGWQLNFPWFNNTAQPLYIHLWDGQGYRIPYNFWFTAPTFENHQGVSFRMVRYSNNSVTLYTGSGDSYFFNPDHSLSTITDATGTNRIIFSYSSNLISCITDTLGRAFLFIYSGRSLQRIAQAYGSCSNPQAFARSVAYMYNGQSLNATVDPAGRITGYAYNATGASTAPWLLARTSYPTHGYSNYTYTVSPQGTESYSYRVSRQYVSSFSAPRIRESDFIYQNAGGNGGGDQVTSSSITSYDGTSTTPLSITSYSFSFMGVNWNVSDGSRNFLRGVEQIFDTHGDISQEINLVTDRTIIGSYTNYYRYDLWGNQIYSRRAVNLSTVKEHFNAYYNDGLSPGFNVFQDTFSDSGLTRPDNFWNSTGLWTVQNGIYNGTYDGKNGLAWSSLGKIAINPISIQAQVYPSRATQQNGEVGLFVDYGGTGTRRLSLLLDSYGLFILNKFDNGTLVSYASSSCPYTNVAWYKFSLTESLSQVIGWVSGPGLYCQVQLSLSPSYSASGSGFGLYVRGYSALFDNVTVTTAISSTNGSDFSNSFMPKGGPGSNIHDALAGSAELNGPLPVEEYNSYYPSGKLSQTAQLYYSSSVVSPSDTQWLNTSRYYDSYGDLVKLVDSTGNYTSYGYSFNPTAYFMTETQILKPGGTQVSRFFQYDFTKGALTLSDDARGYNTTYSYDILGRTIRATYPTGDYEAYSYNDQANYVNVTNENGWLTQQKYDSLGRLASVTRFSGSNAYSTRFYTYNAMDQVTNMTDALGNRFSYQYDALGRVTSVVEPNGYSTRTAYKDCCTFVYVSNIDENGVTNCNYYDRLGRLLNGVENASSTCRPGITTSYSYDAIGNLVQVQTSTLQTIRYAYDNLNRLVNSTYPDGTVEKYSYNKGSNLVLKVDRNSVQTNYSYDSLNRPSAIIYHGTTVTSDNYTYDGNGNLLKLTSQNATLTYNYDSRNRVTGETYSINGGHVTGPLASPSNGPSVPPGTFSSGYSFTYSYTGETLARITYNDFMTTDYTYDGLSRVASVRINTATSHPNATTFSYYPNDRMKGIVFGNGLVASYTYDPVSRPVQLTLKNSTSTLLSLTYSYNNTGTVKSVTGSVNGANISEQYGYDPLRRLTNSLLIKGSTTTTLSYVYDSVGNRQSQTTNGPTTISYSYNPSNNELASSTWYSSHYAYNPTGNLKQWNYTLGTLQTKAYSWDVPGNLVKFFQNGSLQAAYAYDGLGRRVESEEGSTVTFYAYLGTETMVERAPSGADTDYVYANGLRIARVTGAGGVIPTIVYYHEDALGSTRLVTSSTKTVLFSDSYQPYGLDNGTPTGSETYKFTGKPYSAATGLYYDYQRWYDPSLGRFISLDPFAGHLSSPQSLNSYSYGENAPTVLTDPSGLDSCNALDIFSWGGCASNVWNSATSAWNGLSPEEQQGLILIGFIALTAATGGTDLLVLGAVGAAAAAGTYVGATYATGGTPTLAGALTWANIGFGSGTGLDSLGDLAFSARSGLGEISAAERLAANRAAGLGFEERVANMFGLTRNIGVGRTMLEGTETAGRAVPDFVGDTFFGEAKFTQNSVYLTKQIRIMIEGASKAGKDLRIFVPEGTRVAPSVFERGFELGVKVLRIPVP